MKRFTLLALLLVTGVVAWGQRPVAPGQAEQQATYQERFEQMTRTIDRTIPSVNQIAPQQSAAKTGGVATVSPIATGQASNIYSVLRGEQNQAYYDAASNSVGFIHRHNINLWGGNSGQYRFDLSTDGGQTFTSDIGLLTANSTAPSRYPNITVYNPNNENNPFNTFLVYSGPTLGASTWDGHVDGALQVTATNPIPAPATENYNFTASQTLLPGGLCEGLPGEFWKTDLAFDGAAATGDIYVYKGTWNSTTNDVDWVRSDTLSPNHFTAANGGAPVAIGPNISFSPDGNTGWLAWLGDIVGGVDSTVQACFVKSSDGGETWGSPIEVSANVNPDVEDWLTDFWITIDTVTGDTVPVGTGRATLAFDFDLTVDINGNPHLAAVVGNGTSQANPVPGYSIFSGVEKFLGDIWSPDGGATWDVSYVSPILTFRGSFGTSDPVTMDNQPQISRTPNGDHIFYTWVDSDTTAPNGVGFSVSDNLLPNLRIAGLRMSDAAKTCPKLITDGDAIWEGAALFPTAAPDVILSSAGIVSVPIFMVEMLTGAPLGDCQFHYFGNDATIDATAEFGQRSFEDLQWNQCVEISNDVPVEDGIVLGQSFPNPTNGTASIDFNLPFSADVELNLVNMYGQQVAVLANGQYGAGNHTVNVETNSLAAGIYFYNLKSGETTISKKMIVTK